MPAFRHSSPGTAAPECRILGSIGPKNSLDSLGDTSPIASLVLEGFSVEPEELFADLD